MKVILTIKEEDLDFILKQFLVLQIKKIKIKRRVKKQNFKRTVLSSTYNEPNE
ncbi:hypothetical protein SAMN05444407_101302 [Chryseobacterium contaminans]|uniref:Uncharacterized protein n=1 Tax=Chryseobacterium contaminans TaxID=1423959 RepID=A0A1M6VP84_9FLAO|nr:hypothetical protein SAMN05444407_101302 [Chryseobacterium contaminans]